MAIFRDDRWVADAQGRALSGAQVYWLTQPANTSVFPPTPLANLYTSTAGTTPLTNPQVADGFGHASAYLDDSVLYTVAIYHPLFGSNPIILPDQAISGIGASGIVFVPFGGVPSGTINGTNTVFTLTNGGVPLTSDPQQLEVYLNGVFQVPGLGYTLSGTTITYAVAPQAASGGIAADSIYAQGLVAS